MFLSFTFCFGGVYRIWYFWDANRSRVTSATCTITDIIHKTCDFSIFLKRKVNTMLVLFSGDADIAQYFKNRFFEQVLLNIHFYFNNI
jgi:hypothetical protein